MSALNDLDAMVLRQEVYPPMTTKNAELTFTEWDDRVIDIYRVIQDVVNGDNVDAYNPATTYDGTSSDVYLKFVGYNSRIWQAVFAGTFSGETPAEGIYWTQVTLAQMLPNVLKLAEIGSGASQSIKTVKLHIPSADVLTLYTTPVAFGITVPAGYYAQLFSAQMKATYGGTPYATNVTLEIGFPSVKAIFTDNVLGFNSNAFVNMDFESSGAQVSATDVVVSVNAGNPTAGNSDLDIYLTYTLVEL
jgi:hypothetical protein